jgi:hypothetical protein
VPEPSTLDDLLTAMQVGTAARGLAVWDHLPPLLTDTNERTTYPVAHWFGEWEPFLDLAVKAGAKVVYLGNVAFNRETELLEATDEVGYQDDPDPDADAEAVEENLPVGSTQWMLARLRARTEQWAMHEGALMTVTCLWLKDGVAHIFRQQAEWHGAFEEMVHRVLDEADAVREEGSAEETSRLHGLAEEMVRHPRYIEATSEAKREYMAQQLFPDEHPWACRQIALLAALHHWWDVAPSEHASKVQQVRDLYDAGQNITSIAAILKMSRDKVKALLAETQEG